MSEILFTESDLERILDCDRVYQCKDVRDEIIAEKESLPHEQVVIPKIAEKIFDNTGREIKAGDTIYNEHDANGYYQVTINKDGLLCFADDMAVIDKRFMTHEFWKITNR